jgi:hypothetical protein
MAKRTTQVTVSFTREFFLPNFDAPQPAGAYRVDHDEETIEAGGSSGWLRVGSFIHLPAVGVRAATHQMVPVRPGDLDAALASDHAPESIDK